MAKIATIKCSLDLFKTSNLAVVAVSIIYTRKNMVLAIHH